MGTFHFNLLAPVYDKLIKAKKPRALLRLIDKHLPAKEHYEILEIGGGTGRLIQYFVGSPENSEDIQCKLETRSNDLTLLDPSPKMLKEARKKDIPGLRLVQGYAEDLPFEDSSFDLILATDSLHHWRDHELASTEMSRILRRGGIVAIEEINPHKLVGKMVVLFEKLTLMGSRFFPSSSLSDLLSSSGLEIVEIVEYDSPVYHLLATKS